MAYSGDYAIVDATEGSPSEGKILVLLDDEGIALEIANELRDRNCKVLVQPVQQRRTVIRHAATTDDCTLATPIAAVSI